MTPRLTPVDILNKRFSRRFSGYSPAETDEFLRQAAASMEAALLENAAQREQIAALDREVARYRSLENTMRDALILGQTAADEIRDAARAQAAAQIESAQQRLDLLHAQTERLRLDRRRMAHEMKALLESQMAWLDYEIVRDVPQIAAGGEGISASFAALSAGPKSEPVVSTAEYAALTSFPGDFEAETASRNGASGAVPPENA